MMNSPDYFRRRALHEGRVYSTMLLVLLLGIACLFPSCASDLDSADARAQRALKANGPILIGAAWPWEEMGNTLYQDGMEMAVQEINEAGGVLGRPIKIERQDDRATVTEARLVAQRFVSNPDVVAVIGHLQSFTTLPAAAIYDRAGVLLLAPTATDPDLTEKGYNMVFRATFGNDVLGAELAKYAARKGYDRVAVCYISNEYGRELANAFEVEADANGIDVVSRQGYSSEIRPTSANLRPLAREWTAEDLDAVFLAGEVPVAPKLLSVAREIGVQAAFIGGDALRIPRVIELAGASAEGLVVPFMFHPEEKTTVSEAFTKAFSDRFDQRPDVTAAIGYESVHLIAAAIERGKSTVPAAIANAFRQGIKRTGLIGTNRFDVHGNLVGAPVKLMQVQDGAFVPLPAPETVLSTNNSASPYMAAKRWPQTP